MSDSERERAIREKINEQLKSRGVLELKLKYLSEYPLQSGEIMVHASFEWPALIGELPNLKGFSATSKTMFDREPVPPGMVAAQLIAAARWYRNAVAVGDFILVGKGCDHP